MAEFFHMGGYAGYVWSSYAIAIIVLLINFVGPLREHKKLRADIKQQLESIAKVKNETTS